MRRTGEKIILQMNRAEMEALLAREGQLEVEVIVTKIVGNQTHLGLTAPDEVNIVREELVDNLKK